MDLTNMNVNLYEVDDVTYLCISYVSSFSFSSYSVEHSHTAVHTRNNIYVN